MGRIAYLILCHEHPQQLARLLRALHAPEDCAVIHLDARVDAAPFSDAAAGLNVQFVEQRIAVNWAAWSMVQATLACMRAALLLQPAVDRLCLLSGSCYPLLPPAALRQRLLSESLLVRAKPVRPGDPEYVRFERYYLLDHPLLNARRPVPMNLDWGPLRQLVQDFLTSLPPLPPLTMALWKGSQWWCVDRASAEHALAFVADSANAHTLHRFRYSQAPDETLLQSLFGARAGRPTLRDATHYMDWREVSGELPPRVLSSDADLDAALHSGRPFARKFHPQRSAQLLARIDTWRDAAGCSLNASHPTE